MGNILMKQNQEKTYINNRLMPVTLKELESQYYTLIYVKDFTIDDILDKYTKPNLFENKDNVKKDIKKKDIEKMVKYVNKYNTNIDCMCNKNLNICFIKNKATNTTPYFFVEYDTNPHKTSFMRLL